MRARVHAVMRCGLGRIKIAVQARRPEAGAERKRRIVTQPATYRERWVRVGRNRERCIAGVGHDYGSTYRQHVFRRFGYERKRGVWTRGGRGAEAGEREWASRSESYDASPAGRNAPSYRTRCGADHPHLHYVPVRAKRCRRRKKYVRSGRAINKNGGPGVCRRPRANDDQG